MKSTIKNITEEISKVPFADIPMNGFCEDCNTLYMKTSKESARPVGGGRIRTIYMGQLVYKIASIEISYTVER